MAHIVARDLPIFIKKEDFNQAEPYSIAANAVFDTTLTTLHGDGIVKNAAANKSVKLFFNHQTPLKVAGDAIFTITKDNAATVNIYFDAGTYKIQNLTAATVVLQVMIVQY